MHPDAPAILAATGLEVSAVRRRVRGVTVIDAGVACTKLRAGERFDLVVGCGLAGGLQRELPTGSVVIPASVGTTAGGTIPCDAAWTQRLREAARALGYAPIEAALLTSDRLVVGDERAHWAGRGFAAVDMETARIPARAIAAVRVILDTPLRELSPAWLNPVRAFANPRNWGQGMWLAHEGPRCADIAAQIVGAALALL